MDSRTYRMRWGWLVTATIIIALAGAWLSADASVLNCRNVLVMLGPIR